MVSLVERSLSDCHSRRVYAPIQIYTLTRENISRSIVQTKSIIYSNSR